MCHVTYSTCVVVSPGSVIIPHTTMRLVMKSKSLQVIPSSQLYLYKCMLYVCILYVRRRASCVYTYNTAEFELILTLGANLGGARGTVPPSKCFVNVKQLFLL